MSTKILSTAFPAPTMGETPSWEYFWYPVLVPFICTTTLFLYVHVIQCRRDNSHIDVLWAMLFCITNTVILIMRS